MTYSTKPRIDSIKLGRSIPWRHRRRFYENQLRNTDKQCIELSPGFASQLKSSVQQVSSVAPQLPFSLSASIYPAHRSNTPRHWSNLLASKKPYGQRLVLRGVKTFGCGDRTLAGQLFDQAMAWAIEHGDHDLWDRAFCNRCGVDIENGSHVEGLGELREIVLRSSNLENAFLASYNAARAYDLRGDHDRALFYVNIAKNRCGRLARHDWLAWAHNQAGNLYLTKSRIEDACIEYQTALALMPATSRLAKAQVLDNFGYCRMLQGRAREGFGSVFEGLRELRRLGLHREQAPLHLSLCYGYLELDRLPRALSHGLRGLELAEHHGDIESEKNGYYLVGETYNQLGQDADAYDCFRALQQQHFPSTPHIPELLMAVDTRSLVNLKA